MTMTTHIRFLDPVDPRLVWDYARLLIDAPDDYRWEHRPAEGRDYSLNPEWLAEPDQGADAWMRMRYGHEGALLIPDPECSAACKIDCAARDLACEPDPPAYVDLSLDTAYSHCENGKLHDRIYATMALKFVLEHRVNLVWHRGECCHRWHDMIYMPGHCERV